MFAAVRCEKPWDLASNSCAAICVAIRGFSRDALYLLASFSNDESLISPGSGVQFSPLPPLFFGQLEGAFSAM